MKKFTALGIALCFTGALGYAERFTGKLMDASCYNTNKVSSQERGHKTYKSIAKTCAATASTSSFAVRTADGNTIKLDDSGNAQAASAIRSGALKPDSDGDVHVRMHGKLQGETLKTKIASLKPDHGHGTLAARASKRSAGS